MTDQLDPEFGPGTNTGHGHVWARPDGLVARCGGTALCKRCLADAGWLDAFRHASGTRVRGQLTVGINEMGEVVINIGQDLTGHINFSPQQARDLASLLTKKAFEGDESQGIFRN